LHDTRDAALQHESEGEVDLARDTFRVIRHDQHPMGRWCDLVAPNAVRPTTGKITIPGPMPKYGAQTHAILGRLGYGADQIETMVANGAAGTSWSDKYLPE
jgi:crotonobetainyl-CoA:carnitine CoA-transferase CaiB-like acyl-CoA transferase